MSLYSRKLVWQDSKQKLGPSKPSGRLLSVFNQLDIPTFETSYVYVITLPKGRMKGPYEHRLRTTVLTTIFGELEVVYFDKASSAYKKIVVDCIRPTQVIIPPGTPFCLVGVSELPSIAINICDYPWSPSADNECSVPNFGDCPFIQGLIDE